MEHNRVIYERPYDSEIEYLESDGKSYINTEIKASSDIGVYGTINSTKNVEGAIFGARDTNYEFGFQAKGSSGESFYRFGLQANRVIKRNTNFLNKVLIISNIPNSNYFEIGEYIYSAQNTQFTINASITLYTIITQSTNQLLDGLRIYNFKIYNSNTLIRDLIPVRVGNIGYMYDKVSGKLFGNKGRGNFILGSDVANPVPNIRRVFRFGNKRFVMPMPYDSKVEYLESDGNQWVDTDYKPNTNTRTVGRCYFNSFIGSKANYVFGVFAKPNNYGFNVSSTRQFFNVPWGSSDGIVLTGLIPQTNKDYEFDISKTGYKINGTSYGTLSTNLVSSTRNMYLFWSNGTSSSGINGKIYYCKIYNGDTLVHDFIPVRRGNVGYMYDRVSGRLFDNSGTGQFILGNDIND